MRTMTLVVVAVLLVSQVTRADVPEPSAPPVMPAEQPSGVPSGFLDQALKVDLKGQVTEGRANTPISHVELFRRLGREDLLTQSRTLATRRLWLAVLAGTVVVAATVAGSIILATSPRLNSVECESNSIVYNEVCVPRTAQHNIVGSVTIVAGVVAGVALAAAAYWSDPEVTDRDQTAALVSTFNAQLAKNLRRSPSSLKVLPVITPDGAALTAALRF